MVENTGGEISFLWCNRHVQCILNTVQEHLCTILIRRFLWRQKLLCAGVLFTQHVTDLINECRAELSQRLNAMELLGDQSASQSLLFKHLRMQLPLPLEVAPPPLLRLRCLGERFSSPSGSGRSPAAKRYLVNFRLKILPLVATIFRNLGGSALIINALPLSFCKNAPPYFFHGAFAPSFIWSRRPWIMQYKNQIQYVRVRQNMSMYICIWSEKLRIPSMFPANLLISK